MKKFVISVVEVSFVNKNKDILAVGKTLVDTNITNILSLENRLSNGKFINTFEEDLFGINICDMEYMKPSLNIFDVEKIILTLQTVSIDEEKSIIENIDIFCDKLFMCNDFKRLQNHFDKLNPTPLWINLDNNYIKI